MGSGGLTKTGAGTLSLTASNNFTGNTLVSNGVLEVASTGKLYGGGYTTGPTITVASGGTLRLNGWSWDAGGSIANLDYSRDRLVVNGGTIEYTGNSNFNPGDPGSSSRNLTVGTGGATLKASSASGQTWTISSGNGDIINNNGLTLDGAGAGAIQKIIEGTGSVTKTGSGTWTLSGANTYTGDTLVSAGTLLISGALGDTDVTVNGGAFGGTGTVGGSLTITSGYFHVANLGDALVVDGTINLFSGFGVANLTGLDWGTVADGTYTILDGTLGSGVFGSLANNSSATAFGIGGGRSAYFQSGSLQLVVVPEPGTALLGGLGILALLRRLRSL